MPDPVPTFTDRPALLASIRGSLIGAAEILKAAKDDVVLFPEGLPATLDRTMRFTANMAFALAPAESEPETAEQTVVRLCAQVDAERDRRIDSGFTFAAHEFQSRPSDRENIMGAAQLAIAAIGQGAQPGDLRWANPDQDFVWITADNDLLPLDAHTTVGLFQAGVAFKSALTFYARGLKDAIIAAENPAAVDTTDGWPG